MFPVGAVALALFFAFRAANSAGKGGAPRQPDKPLQRTKRSIWSSVGPIGAGVTLIVVLTCLDAGLALWKVAPLLLAGTFVTFPWPIASRIFVPLGWVRPAFWLARLSTFWISRDEGFGGGVLAAALAAARRPTPQGIAWVEAKLAQEKRLYGATLVAAGALAYARGDRDAARGLFEMTDHIATAAIPGTARRIAMTWRLADAAERGEWRNVIGLGEVPGVAFRETAFLRQAALRLVGHPAALSNFMLVMTWLFSPFRRGGLPILRRALAEPWVLEETPLKIPTDDPLAEAIILQARTDDASGAVDASDVLALASAWDRALADPALAQHVEERARTLGADPARVVRRLRDSAVEDIATVALSANVQLAGRSGVGAAALGVMRTRLLGDVDIAAAALRERVEAQRSLSALDEWREFTMLRSLHVRAARSLDIHGRRMSFHTASRPLCSQAVWLFNKRDEKVIANAMFRWLLEEANAVEDTRLSDLFARNAECGIA